MTLLSRSKTVLPTHSKGVSAIFKRVLSERNINVAFGCEVKDVADGTISCTNGMTFDFDECVWCTQGRAQPWIKECGFETDKDGFLAVDTFLESVNTPDVFAAGDVASIVGHPRPKAGVFAVMAGMPLSLNLKKRLEGGLFVTVGPDQNNPPGNAGDQYLPQSEFLGLIGTGDGGCVASKGQMAVESRAFWDLKDWIDRKWMWNYTVGLPDMEEMMAELEANKPLSRVALAAGKDALAMLEETPMRCGGCGAKVGGVTLSNAMGRLQDYMQPVHTRDEVVVGLDSPDDCAVVETGNVLGVHTVDFFRGFYEDPYTFGIIAANHSLSDCHAMGCDAVSVSQGCNATPPPRHPGAPLLRRPAFPSLHLAPRPLP